MRQDVKCLEYEAEFLPAKAGGGVIVET